MNRQAGFTLVSAIFLLVVLVTLSISLVTISAVQHTTSAQYLQSVRAGYAVRAGLEWAVAKSATSCPASATTLALGGTLSPFSVSVLCTQTSHTQPATSAAAATSTQVYYVADVTAIAGAYGSTDYVLRKGQGKILGPVTTP